MENDNNDKIINNSIIFDIDGEKKEIEIIEQTVIDGITYILVCEKDADDGDCFILKDLSDINDDTANYSTIDNDDELEKVFDVFKNILKNDSIELKQ